MKKKLKKFKPLTIKDAHDFLNKDSERLDRIYVERVLEQYEWMSKRKPMSKRTMITTIAANGGEKRMKALFGIK